MNEIELIKQRRNVLILSTLLILFDVAQISIEEVSILGTNLIIGKQELIMPFFMVLWAYSVLRYYQYRREAGVSKLQRVEKKKKLEQYVRDFCFRDAGNIISNQRVVIERLGWFGGRARIVSTIDDSEVIPSIKLPFYHTMIWQLKALFWVVFVSLHFTDHGLPLIMVIWALGVILFK